MEAIKKLKENDGQRGLRRLNRKPGRLLWNDYMWATPTRQGHMK